MFFLCFCLFTDLTYLHRSPLDSEFDQIAAELEAAEREETNEELGGEESAQVCALPRPISNRGSLFYIVAYDPNRFIYRISFMSFSLRRENIGTQSLLWKSRPIR